MTDRHDICDLFDRETSKGCFRGRGGGEIVGHC